jgi:hypothetical protein
VSDVGLAVSALCAFALTVIYTALVFRKATLRTPKGVIRRLQARGGPFSIRVPMTGGTWNPAKPPGIDHEVLGPGRATYALDDSGVVHLYFHRKDSELHFSGAIPESISNQPPRHQRVTDLRRRILLGYVSFLLIGFVVGAMLAPGPVVVRLAWGCLGVLVAMVIASVLVRMFSVGHAVRETIRHPRGSKNPTESG